MRDEPEESDMREEPDLPEEPDSPKESDLTEDSVLSANFMWREVFTPPLPGTPTSFPRFSELPVELRARIIKYSFTMYSYDEDCSTLVESGTINRRIPEKLEMVSREFKEVTQKLYWHHEIFWIEHRRDARWFIDNHKFRVDPKASEETDKYSDDYTDEYTDEEVDEDIDQKSIPVRFTLGFTAYDSFDLCRWGRPWINPMSERRKTRLAVYWVKWLTTLAAIPRYPKGNHKHELRIDFQTCWLDFAAIKDIVVYSGILDKFEISVSACFLPSSPGSEDEYERESLCYLSGDQHGPYPGSRWIMEQTRLAFNNLPLLPVIDPEDRALLVKRGVTGI